MLLRPPAFVREVRQVEARHETTARSTSVGRLRAKTARAERLALLRAAEAAEALDWEAFSNRYFPGRRRHDMEALTAYATYKQGREWRTTPARLTLVPTEHVSAAVERESEEAGTQRLLAAMAEQM